MYKCLEKMKLAIKLKKCWFRNYCQSLLGLTKVVHLHPAVSSRLKQRLKKKQNHWPIVHNLQLFVCSYNPVSYHYWMPIYNMHSYISNIMQIVQSTDDQLKCRFKINVWNMFDKKNWYHA